MQDEQTPAEHYEQPIGHLWQGSTEEDVTEKAADLNYATEE